MAPSQASFFCKGPCRLDADEGAVICELDDVPQEASLAAPANLAPAGWLGPAALWAARGRGRRGTAGTCPAPPARVEAGRSYIYMDWG